MSLAWIGVATALAGTVPADAPRFRAESQLVRIDVAVARRGEPLAGLTGEDFHVQDDGVDRHVAMVSRSDKQVHAVLVFDLSGSMAGDRLDELKRSASAFLQSLEVSDRVTLLTFTDVVHRIAGPVDPATAVGALAPLRAGGTTSVNDALFAAIHLARTAPGAAFVLLVTDGVDEMNWMSHASVVQSVREGDVPVHVLAVGEQLTGVLRVSVPGSWKPNSPRDDWDELFAWFGAFLEQVAGDTGGRVWMAHGDMHEAFVGLLAEVKNHYSLVFERPPDARRGWHELKVRLRGRKGDVRARKGYFVR